ncbi:MAG: RNA polymerase-binding protein DksA, partial [Proteobacteria bacterium]|nr:RNA polymerase-binding protein DksA [Pseudomonadota bacterium]
MATRLPRDYRPTEDEPFMNARQREYFRRKLVAWRAELLRESNLTLQNLQQSNVPAADVADRATTESERSLELRTR